LPLRIFESCKAAASEIPYFWYSLSEPKSTLLFGGVAVGGTLLLSLAIWIGIKELKIQSLPEGEMQEGEFQENLSSLKPGLLTGLGLKWKIPCAFAGMTALLGLLVVATVYRLTGRALRSQMEQQATVIATNLGDAAADYIPTQNFSELNGSIAKYARLDGVAYAFIEDDQGKIVAHSLEAFPPELRESLTFDERRQADRRTLTFMGRAVYEIRLPILKTGAVTHVGIWKDSVEDEIYRIILPIVGLLTIVLVSGILLSFFLARSLVRPIRQLTDIAGTISLGNLDTPINIESRDEIEELARSLERMRASLRAAMVRLTGDHEHHS
jgi:HAMP domain-containing protein